MRRVFWQLTVPALLLAAGARAGDAPPVVPDPARSAFYAEQPVTLTYAAGRLPADFARLTLAVMYSGRAVIRQEPAPQFPLTVRFTFPHLEPGVVAPAELVFSFLDANNRTVAEHRQRLFFFSRKHLAPRAAELAKRRFAVYAPTFEALAPQLQELGVPAVKVDSLADLEPGWLICAGLDFDALEGLAADLRQFAGKGGNVLVLPPFSGTIDLPANDLERLEAVTAAQLRALDKRLDPEGAPDARAMTAVLGAFVPVGDGVGLRFARDGHWPWVDLRHGRGRLVFCGWDLLGARAERPAAVRVFELLFTDNDPGQTTDRKE